MAQKRRSETTTLTGYGEFEPPSKIMGNFSVERPSRPVKRPNRMLPGEQAVRTNARAHGHELPFNV